MQKARGSSPLTRSKYDESNEQFSEDDPCLLTPYPSLRRGSYLPLKEAVMRTYEEIPFENEEGHKFQPGDLCVALAVGAGHGAVYKGTYLGMRNGKVALEVDDVRRRYQNAEGEDYDWLEEARVLNDPEMDAYPYRHPFGSTEYNAARKRMDELLLSLREGYSWVKIPCKRRTYLQRNRIYPGDLNLW